MMSFEMFVGSMIVAIAFACVIGLFGSLDKQVSKLSNELAVLFASQKNSEQKHRHKNEIRALNDRFDDILKNMKEEMSQELNNRFDEIVKNMKEEMSQIKKRAVPAIGGLTHCQCNAKDSDIRKLEKRMETMEQDHKRMAIFNQELESLVMNHIDRFDAVDALLQDISNKLDKHQDILISTNVMSAYKTKRTLQSYVSSYNQFYTTPPTSEDRWNH